MSANDTTVEVTDRVTASSIEKMLNDEPTEVEEAIPLETPKAPGDEEEKTEEPELEDEIKVELEDLEDEDDEETAKEEDLVVNFPRRREILAKYPNVFKDFPALQTALYKVGKVNEIFPSLDDAKAAVFKSQVLDRIEQDVMQGNIEPLLNEIRNGNKNSFNRIVDNILPSLYKIDPGVVQHVQKDVIGRMVIAMYEDAKERDSEEIKQAADVVKALIFGNGKIESKKLATEDKPDPERIRLEQERAQFNQQRYQDTASEMADNIQTLLKAAIDKFIDPKGSMTAYVRKHANQEALTHLEDMMRNDASFRAIVDRCWQNIFRTNYSKESIEKLKNVYKSRASTLMPTAIKKARNEALKTTKDKSEVTKIKSGRVAPEKDDGRPQSKGKEGKKMSTYDFLMKD
jgi:hypothetical protein